MNKNLPHIERPYAKNYRNKPIREFDSNQTIYQIIMNANENNKDYIAMRYFGNKFSYEKAMLLVDKAALAYKKNGIGLGDVVLLAMPNVPETIINFIALNKIGAVSKWIDMRSSANEMEHYLNQSNCKIMITFDKLLPTVESMINNTDVQKVLYVSPDDSMNIVMKTLFKIKQIKEGNKLYIPESNKIEKFSSFTSNVPFEKLDFVKFDKDRPSVIVQSSGTTGPVKDIIHSDLSFSSLAITSAYSFLPFAPKKKMLTTVPPWVAYSLANSTFLALIHSMELIVDPMYDNEICHRNLGKYNMAMATPFQWKYMAEHYEAKFQEAYRMIECAMSGGDKITPNELKEIMATTGIEVCNGWGDNEGLGALAFNTPLFNKAGAVGFPKYGDDVMIWDEDNKKMLGYNETGEVCIKSDTMFIEYADNAEKTKSVKQNHEGDYYIHTGDLGRVDHDGYIFLEGRKERVITRFGYKLSALKIEESIGKCPVVKECIAVAVPDEEERETVMLFYTVKNEYLNDLTFAENEIIEYCKKHVKENMNPKYLQVVETIPVTKNNKYDFRTAEKLGREYVAGLGVQRIKK